MLSQGWQKGHADAIHIFDIGRFTKVKICDWGRLSVKTRIQYIDIIITSIRCICTRDVCHAIDIEMRCCIIPLYHLTYAKLLNVNRVALLKDVRSRRNGELTVDCGCRCVSIS